MPATSTTPQVSASPTAHRWLKPALWAAMAAMTISVIFYSEVPLFHKQQELDYLRTILWVIIPHAVAGITAFLTGPLQFSSRLRRRNPKFHRILGRVYVSSVFVAAPLAILLATFNHNPQAIYFTVANIVQAGTWMIATAAAFLTARNRHIQQHREWMVRSYALTFTFVGTRVLQPIPAWNDMGRVGFATAIIIITFLAILIPDIALHWRQLTTRRA
jgi:uncharacterized membrane protein